MKSVTKEAMSIPVRVAKPIIPPGVLEKHRRQLDALTLTVKTLNAAITCGVLTHCTATGTHLTLPDYTSPASMGLVWFTTDGRVLYLLPWEGATIAGTTGVACVVR